MNPLRPLTHRVDALTLAFRVALDPAFVEALRARAEVAKKHGRASFSWKTRVPVDASGKRLGPIRAHWADDHPVGIGTPEEVREVLWGELRYSRALRVWNITNEPFFRLHVDLGAPGGELREERTRPREVRDALEAAGREPDTEPGWTVEIVWYAQELARRGLAAALEESLAIARAMGDVRETRLRRIDLCADVAGWRIVEGDEARLVKRSRAKWSKDYADPVPDDDDDERGGDTEKNAQSYARRVPRKRLARDVMHRPLTGLSVGRGGALMSRIYDKRAELEADAVRREQEEDRWREAGWDGLEPVTRVEFQIRGVAVKELGLRDPDCILETVRDARGRASGQRVATVQEDGRERQATLPDVLDRVWSMCLGWVRLVNPDDPDASYTKRGRLKQPSRLPDDPRWAVLRGLRFTDHACVAPAKRFRARGAASAAQALGVTLSQAARDGALPHWSDRPETYEAHPAAESLLRARVLSLKVQEAERVIRWLLDRCEGPVNANVHLAVRADAAATRFRPPLARGASERDGPPPSGTRLVRDEDGETSTRVA